MNLWLASNNPHKKQELAAILRPHQLRTPDEISLAFDPEELGQSFMENALLKARALHQLIGETVIADDSGLCVEALDGWPGLFSARYGAENGLKLTAAERNAKLLSELGEASDRRAYFVCAMVLLFRDQRFYLVQETLEGEILKTSRGSAGFGYDPIVYLPDYGLTVAELDEAEKNRLSHRGKAGRAIAKLLSDQEV